MSLPSNPYDEVAYPTVAVEWMAPERLAMAACVHGGPRPALESYRVLELGSGNGANLLPLAFYRQSAEFVGVDYAAVPVQLARERAQRLGLSNVTFLQCDFAEAQEQLVGKFDYIIAHGVLSWISDEVREAVLALCSERLTPQGLLLMSYNAQPGWTIRGLLRRFLMTQTEGQSGLSERIERAFSLSGKLSAIFQLSEHPFSQLMAAELKFLMESQQSYVAHEFLAEHNRAYWRSEFLALMGRHNLSFVGDADFNYPSGRIPGHAEEQLAELMPELPGGADDLLDFLFYRQLHCPVLSRSDAPRIPLENHELAQMYVASCLRPISPNERYFVHPSLGTQVEAKDAPIHQVLSRVHKLWPRGVRLCDLTLDIESVRDDLLLLQRSGLIELRLVEPADAAASAQALHALESEMGSYHTTAYHTRISILPPAK